MFDRLRVLSARSLAAFALLFGGAVTAGAWSAWAGAASDETTGHGLYMSRAADCAPCHTRPGGTPLAGGLQIKTPFGMLTSPNITPDPDTGIGRWTDEQFYRALHDGIGHGGEFLYPVMPFPSYTKMTREDVLAIRQYLMSLKPVFAPRVSSAMDFPFDVRKSIVRLANAVFPSGCVREQDGPFRRMESRRLSGPGAGPLRGVPLAAQPSGRYGDK